MPASPLARLLAPIALASVASIALAHEFWIDASSFRPKVGELVRLRTMVGDGFPGESRPRDPTKLERFELAGAGQTQPILGREGSEPAGIVRLNAPGTYVVGYRSRSTSLLLPGPKFEKYLAEKGLDDALAARRAAGTPDADGRERFSRCSKAILSVGDDAGSGFDHNFNFPFEIIPLVNPYTLHAGDEMPVLVLSDGKPAANFLVTAMSREKPAANVSARTDAEGHVSLKLDQPGVWLLNTVRMTPVHEAGVDCDWESLWASLTFDLATAPSATTSSK